MKMKKKTFIVSCQALPEEPMYGKGIPFKMVKSAIKGGAKMVRISQMENINEVKRKLNIPFIALIKKNYPESQVFISPTLKELKELIKTNAPIIAIDATMRHRPKESLEQMVRYFRMNKNKGQELMADCATIEDVANADRLGFDYIGTTMRGYTDETKGLSNTKNDFEFLEQARKTTKRFLIAEGGINSPELAKQAMEIADAVVVGSAITRPDYITALYVKYLRGE